MHNHFLKRFKMKIYTLLAVGLLHICSLTGQTTLPATINTNTSLTKAGSPYIIESNLTVSPGVTLNIEAGVQVELALGTKITVNGKLYALGNSGDSVYFQSKNSGEQWENIVSSQANIELSYIKVTGAKMLLSASGGDSIKITHSNITSLARGYGEDCIAAHDAHRVTIEYITLKGAGGKIADGIKNDAIDLDNVDSCFISDSHISNFSDDAIDIGTNTKYALISRNFVDHSNFGITVGESSLAYLDNITSYNNDGGFQVHTNAIIYCRNNTLYANTAGIECYHSEEGEIKQTGGTAVVKNTLFSQTHGSEITKQSSSSVTISYSLSDKEILPGAHNLKDDPMLTDPENGNFKLKPGSPCFNAGDPGLANEKINIGVYQLPDSADAIQYLADRNNDYTVFPNPAENFIRIKIPYQTGKLLVASICDLTGRILISKQFDSEFNCLDISALESGMYVLQILSENQKISTLKFYKK
jgi:hypothetical protein